MLEVVESFKVGLQIMVMLEARQFELPNSTDDFFLLEAYQNGREHGIVLWDTKLQKSYSVAVHRRSDDVVVYYGNYVMQSLSEDAYHNAHFFSTPEEAVDFIIQHIKTVRTVKD